LIVLALMLPSTGGRRSLAPEPVL